MKSLPPLARLYVGSVIALGAGLLVVCFPVQTLGNPWLFLLLLALSSITSVFKVTLPLARGRTTMSVSYAVDFASLLLLGPLPPVVVVLAVTFVPEFDEDEEIEVVRPEIPWNRCEPS